MALLAAAPAAFAFDDEDDEEATLRERLTEREDKRRSPDPIRFEIGDLPVVFAGELEWALLQDRRVRFDERRRDRLALEQTVDLEWFATLGKPLSAFAQLSVEHVDDLLSGTPERRSELFVERGEMWLISEELFGWPLHLEIGRLDFEDERRWWWNEELDAIRAEWEAERWDLSVAIARELASNRTGQGFVDPEQERVLRVIVEGGWEWRENHAIEWFLLHEDDRSPNGAPGERVRRDREDESDARLHWFGVRAMGAIETRRFGLFGYWADLGFVWGRERLVAFEEEGDDAIVEGVTAQRVRGTGVDVGAQWLWPGAWEPRLFAGIAWGSGDDDPDDGRDRAYRQSRLQSNEAGFGGVERYPHYGILLEPELSNLWVATVGVGFTIFESSSIDVAWHGYRLDEPSEELRDAFLDAELDGRSRRLGQALDVVLAIEEWERWELEGRLSWFRAGRAFGANDGRWSQAAFVSLRYAF